MTSLARAETFDFAPESKTFAHGLLHPASTEMHLVNDNVEEVSASESMIEVTATSYLSALCVWEAQTGSVGKRLGPFTNLKYDRPPPPTATPAPVM